MMGGNCVVRHCQNSTHSTLLRDKYWPRELKTVRVDEKNQRITISLLFPFSAPNLALSTGIAQPKKPQALHPLALMQI